MLASGETWIWNAATMQWQAREKKLILQCRSCSIGVTKTLTDIHRPQQFVICEPCFYRAGHKPQPSLPTPPAPPHCQHCMRRLLGSKCLYCKPKVIIKRDTRRPLCTKCKQFPKIAVHAKNLVHPFVCHTCKRANRRKPVVIDLDAEHEDALSITTDEESSDADYVDYSDDDDDDYID